MAVARVQAKYAFTAGPTTSVAATFDSTPTSGNVLLALYQTVDAPTITGPSGWTQVETVFQDSFADTTCRVWRKTAGASESTTVTVTTDMNKNQDLQIIEYSGVDTTTPIEDSGTSLSSGGVTTLLTDSVVTAAAGAVVVGMAQGYNLATWANTWTNSFVRVGYRDSFFATAERITTAGGTYSTTETWTGSCPAASVIVALKASTGGAIRKRLTLMGVG